MIAALSSLILALASSSVLVSANPIFRQIPGSWCSGLGEGGFDTAYNFTLVAYNTTLPDSNSTGVPLVIAGASTVPGAVFQIYASVQIIPFCPCPRAPNSSSSSSPTSCLPRSADADPAGGGTGFPILTANPNPYSFFLCSMDGQYSVFNNPVAGSAFGYDVDSCYNVVLQIVEPV